MNRRTFLRRSAVLGGSFAVISPFEALGLRVASGAPPVRVTGYGPLVDKGELMLPEAFNYQVISRQGEIMSDGFPTPSCFDGMGSFPGPHGTTILIRNHENRIARNPGGNLEIPVVVPPGFAYDDDRTMRAGCTKLEVRREAEGVYTVVNHFGILGGTDNNCAGGVLPSKRWLTCEEVVRVGATSGKKHGYVFEVDATSEGPVVAVPIPQMGRIAHEAAVWHAGIVYLTEDRTMAQGGSCLYRFVPDNKGQSNSLADTPGVLQALKVRNEPTANMDLGRVPGVSYAVEWVTVPEPDHDDHSDMRRDRVPGFTPLRFQAQDRGAAFFDRQEGMWTGSGKIYFDCTTGGALDLGQIWEYDPGREILTLLYESSDEDLLEGPDNIVVVRQTGDLFLCEDATAPQYVRGLTQQGEIYDFARSVNNTTEFAGACFDPGGHTLFLNQYGVRELLPDGTPGSVLQGGVTYAIYGPFEKREGSRRGN